MALMMTLTTLVMALATLVMALATLMITPTTARGCRRDWMREVEERGWRGCAALRPIGVRSGICAGS
jgi:hypothetical protein